MLHLTPYIGECALFTTCITVWFKVENKVPRHCMMILSIMAFRIITLKLNIATLSINSSIWNTQLNLLHDTQHYGTHYDTQHNEIQHKELNLWHTAEHFTVILDVVCRYDECRYVERRYPECRGAENWAQTTCRLSHVCFNASHSSIENLQRYFMKT